MTTLPPTITITISLRSLLRIAAAVLVVWFLYVIRDIITLFLIAVVITAALAPIIEAMSRRGVPRLATVTFVYVAFFGLAVFLVAVIAPLLFQQLHDLVANLLRAGRVAPTNPIVQLVATQDGTATVARTLAIGSLGDLFARTASVVSVIVATLATLSMAFYLSLQRDGLRRFLRSITPPPHRPYVMSLVTRIQESFARWMAGQLITMLFVGALYFVLLTALGVPYALVLGVLGGILEIIPYLGPVMSVVPAALLGFVQSPTLGALVVGGYILINLLENHVLIPQIMNKATGLNPVAVILALMVGAKVAGLVGVLLAVPIAGAVSLFLKDLLEHRVGERGAAA